MKMFPGATLTGWIWAVARMLLLSYAGLCIVLYLVQDRLLYHPVRGAVATPSDEGMAFEAVRLPTGDADTTTLHAWWIPAADARGTVLFWHGNAGNLSHRVSTLRWLHELGLNVLAADYRGYGESGGTPSESAFAEDAQTLWRHARETRAIPPERIVLYGRSLGGAVAAGLADVTSPAGLALESTFTSLPDMAAMLYPWLPARALCRSQYPTRKRVAEMSMPVLVAHAPEDDVIPYVHGRRLFEAAGERGTFHELGGGHNATRLDALYAAAWVRWLDRVLPPEGVE